LSLSVLVTGGARSGKSTFAEQICARLSKKNVIYIATGIAFDEEMKERIKKHRSQRPCDWYTLEAYAQLEVRLNDLFERKEHNDGTIFDCALLDCLTIMTNNFMMDLIEDWDNISDEQAINIEMKIKSEIKSLYDFCKKHDIHLVIVTNEVGMGIVPEYKSARYYRDIAGRVNQYAALMADEVYLCVSGIPVKIKNKLEKNYI